MNFPERKNKVINYLKTYESISNQEAQGLTNAHRNTITSDFRKLFNEGLIQKIGRGKGARYILAETVLFNEEFTTGLWNIKNSQALERFFSQQNRKKGFFNRTVDKALNAQFEFAKEIEAIFEKSLSNIKDKRQALAPSERKRKKS